MAKKNEELERIERQGRMKVVKLIFGLLCAVIIVLYGLGNNVYKSGSEHDGSADRAITGEGAPDVQSDVRITDAKADESADSRQTFPAVEPPMYLRADRGAALEWLSEHYWDNWLETIDGGSNAAGKTKDGDTAGQTLEQKSGQLTDAFAGYVNVLSQVEYEKACKGIGKLFGRLEEKGSRKALLGVMKAAEDVLYDPNSPMLDEELYIPVLEGILASKLLSSDDKLAYRANYEIVKINRKGTRARDFEYIYLTGDGNGKKLSSLYRTKAEYLIVYFNNPGCTSCKEIKQRLSQEMFFRQMIADKELMVLSVYPDEDLQQWEEDFKDFPNEWIYAADPSGNIKDDNRWGIRAIPSLYLLDRDKTVLLKDTSIEAIMEVIISAHSK